MNSMHRDGQLQLDAGLSLLIASRLVQWDTDPSSRRMRSNDHQSFEVQACDADPRLGRLMYWILFSAGAEFLAKGVCLMCGIEVRMKPKRIPVHPDDLSSGVQTTNFGTIGDLTKVGGHLEKLCAQTAATSSDREQLLNSYTFLQKSIRNRDAHAYVENVREAQFPWVESHFVPAFNLLLHWLPE